jgi:hypothetical protein
MYPRKWQHLRNLHKGALSVFQRQLVVRRPCRCSELQENETCRFGMVSIASSSHQASCKTASWQKWNTYEVDIHRPYGNSREEIAPTLSANRYRHSPNCVVATFRKISAPSQILRKLELDSHMTNYTRTYNGFQFKSKILHNGTRSATARPSYRLCSHPAVFFFSFVSLRFYSQRKNVIYCSKTILYQFLAF